MTKLEKKLELIDKEYYPDIRTAVNALKFIDSDYARLAIDLGYGANITMNPYPFNNYINDGYPVMFIYYDSKDDDFWFEFHNVDERFVFPWKEKTSMTKAEIIKAGWEFYYNYDSSLYEDEALAF